jgi:NAD(P)-dependent dehydrogenase (short-subunit alcohol dehydrogenase family)
LDTKEVDRCLYLKQGLGTTELLHTMAANAVAPFVLCGQLLPLLAPPEPSTEGEPLGRWGHIINVSALEGKFAVGKKSTRHPQTNMSKAALNMMTFTCAREYFQRSVLVNAVDTGWVTDNAPGGLGAKAQTHETHVAPPLDEDDGASRVLDPIFRHLNSRGEFRQHGFFWKDYEVSSW